MWVCKHWKNIYGDDNIQFLRGIAQLPPLADKVRAHVYHVGV